MSGRGSAAALLGLAALTGWCAVIGLASLWLFADLGPRRPASLTGRVAGTPVAQELPGKAPHAEAGATLGRATAGATARVDATQAPGARRTLAPRRVTATPRPPRVAEALPPAVDWPATPDLSAREPLTRTTHFRVFPASADDALLRRQAETWAPRLEAILAAGSRRLGGRTLDGPVDLVFARAYPARCPARGLAATRDAPPLLMVFVDEQTTAIQLEAVLAHEMAHHLSLDDHFVGDGVLTEGIANWAGGEAVLRWQGFENWPSAVRRYWREGRYVSITDPAALSPRAQDEDCIARRDRVYNIRTAFVDWLIAQVGLPTVLAMPVAEVTWTDPGSGEAGQARLPDYERAAGADLVALERRFLRSLSLGGPEVVMLELRPELQGVDFQ